MVVEVGGLYSVPLMVEEVRIETHGCAELNQISV